MSLFTANRIFTPPSSILAAQDGALGALGSWTWPIRKTPMFSSNVQTPLNLRNEVGLANAPYPIWLFDYDFSYLKGAEGIANTSADNSGLAYVLGFYGSQLARAGTWLFNDPFDNSVTNELFGWGDGATTQFQLQRSINGQFLDIIQNPNSISSIAVAGTPLVEISANGYYIGLENLLEGSVTPASSAFAPVTTGGASAPVTSGGITAPDGTTNAVQLAYGGTGAGQSSYLTQLIPAVPYAGCTFTFSIWLEAPVSATVYLSITDNSPAAIVCQAQAIAVANTWTRYQITGAFPSVVIPGYKIVVSIGLAPSMASATVNAWGCQLERNPNASGYILTTTAPVLPNGVVTFRQAPPAGSALTWTGTFWNRCRFDEDQISDLQQFMLQIWELESLKFHSVILGDV